MGYGFFALFLIVPLLLLVLAWRRYTELTIAERSEALALRFALILLSAAYAGWFFAFVLIAFQDRFHHVQTLARSTNPGVIGAPILLVTILAVVLALIRRLTVKNAILARRAILTCAGFLALVSLFLVLSVH